MRKKLLYGALVILPCVFFYAWGILSMRHNWFPFPTFKKIFIGERNYLGIAKPRHDLSRSEQLERLISNPYLAGYQAAGKDQGVTLHNRKSSWPGLNLYCSGHAPEAILMDMEGKVLHRWHYDFSSAWPHASYEKETEKQRFFWHHVHLFENGDLLAVFDRLGLIKIDKNSNLLWAWQGSYHHDVHLQADGTLWTLSYEKRRIPELNAWNDIGENFIVALDVNGREIQRYSVLELFRRSGYRYLMFPVDSIKSILSRSIDIFHTNSIEVFDGRLAEKSPLFQKGNILVSIRELNTVAIINVQKKEIVWAMGPNNFVRQHNAKLLENGHILLFDNGTDASRVVEFNPIDNQITWEYQGDPPASFFSKYLGYQQRLPNGNTLITESMAGRAFEVTPDKSIVWEFLSPHLVGNSGNLVAALFEMQRVNPGVEFWK
jgi:hypothetical protein